ncbi:Gram-negative bacterial tonB protein [Variovorax sp. SRS16]|uniref:energy transducer TonB n=1 Tax=Variovorax sp. SRS16 TaxID=282217 RepID=UPI00131666E4|nr:energy transducer TonB [Variovorax sp. SRS16]VTU34004.1 Gram-negative bacterial tonB protein [Variovorax sp. SRS16]
MTALASTTLPGPGFAASRLRAGRWVLPVCAIFSLALHASLLAVHVAPRQAAHGAGGNPRTLQVRLQPAPTAAPSVTPIAPQRPAVAEPVVAATPAARPAPRVEAVPIAETAAPPVATPPPAAGAEAAAPIAIASSAVATADRDDYVPRPLLSVPPVAMTPVLLAAPPGETALARYVGILSLFIDEQGKVQDVIADKPDLPAAFEQAAREAFMAARFAPGQIDGRGVKSRQRVEVVFDNTPLAGR